MNNKFFYSFVALLLVASIGFWIYMFGSPSTSEHTQAAEEISLTMYHSPGCQCCVKWAAYLQNRGVEVTIEQAHNLQEIKEEHGVPNQLSSCHTAVVDGYVVEGHVPVEDIRKMLAERPDVIGISVPGMPQNSPGMDMPSDQSYQSVLFDEDENVSVYGVHN